jgi:mono/diheme cytochrome c family protein
VIALWLACTPSGPFLDPGVALNEVPSVVHVGDPVSLSVTTAGSPAVAWDLGDGDTATGTQVAHAWDAPGRYLITVTAEGAVDSASVFVVEPPLDTPPERSGRLDGAGDLLFAVLPEADQVARVDLHAGTIEHIDVCGHPTALDYDADSGLLVVACRDDAVAWVAPDGSVNTVALPWGSRPTAVVLDAAGALTAVLAGTGEIVRITPSSYQVVATGLHEPRGLVAGPDGLVTVGGVSPATHGRWWHVADGVVTEHTLLSDAGPDSDTDARGVPTGLLDVGMRPDGGALAIAGLKANMDAGLWRDGTELGHDNAVRAVLRNVSPDGTEGTHPRFDNRDRARAVAWTPLGDVLFVAHHGAQVVDLLDPYTMQRIGGLQGVGAGAEGLWSDGDTVWVLLGLDLELVQYQVRLDGVQVELQRLDLSGGAAETAVDRGRRIFHDSVDPRMSTDAYISCASCHWDGGADGLTWDFTQRGEGLRSTLPLWAMPLDGPFHWSANFDELQDFENDIRVHQTGDGYLSDADWDTLADPLGESKAGASAELDDLAAYMESLVGDVPRSPLRQDDGSLTEAGVRGAQVFQDQGCERCHVGGGSDAAFVDGVPVLHDVGTLTDASGQRMGGELPGLRTPPLFGLHASAPYLHDGSAPTLSDALVAHGIDPDPDLIDYLLQLED